MPDLVTTIEARFAELLAKGTQLVEQFDNDYPVAWHERPDCIAWQLSAVNPVEVALPSSSRHLQQARRLVANADETIYPNRLANLLGVLSSAHAEWSRGLLLDLEFRFVGPAFEEFLRHATDYLESGRKMESAILASAVLEDTVKKVCRKFSIDHSDKELDTLISALGTKKILGKVKAQPLRAAATVRNKAFHADWDSFDERDVKQIIESVEELVEAYSTPIRMRQPNPAMDTDAVSVRRSSRMLS